MTMSKTLISFNAKTVDASPISRTLMSISAYDVDLDTVLENFDIEQIVNFFSAEELLEEIGEEKARQYFESREK